MSKNNEILAEIITEQAERIERLISIQSELVKEHTDVIERAQKTSINTVRLEEVISHWNELFVKQKTQIKELQEYQIKNNNIHRVITYFLLLMAIGIQSFLIYKTFV